MLDANDRSRLFVYSCHLCRTEIRRVGGIYSSSALLGHQDRQAVKRGMKALCTYSRVRSAGVDQYGFWDSFISVIIVNLETIAGSHDDRARKIECR